MHAVDRESNGEACRRTDECATCCFNLLPHCSYSINARCPSRQGHLARGASLASLWTDRKRGGALFSRRETGVAVFPVGLNVVAS
jgi:hypothetical protein